MFLIATNLFDHSYSCDCPSCRDCQPWWEESAEQIEHERLAGPRVLVWVWVLGVVAGRAVVLVCPGFGFVSGAIVRR